MWRKRGSGAGEVGKNGQKKNKRYPEQKNLRIVISILFKLIDYEIYICGRIKR